MHITSVYDAFENDDQLLIENYGEDAAQPIINELKSLRRRVLAAAYTGAPVTTHRKMSQEKADEADEILKCQPVERLLRIEADMALGFEIMNTSPNSRNTYGARLKKFVERAKGCSYWPKALTLNIQDQCRPPRHLSGRRNPSDLPLTLRSGQYEQYRLTVEETPPSLQAELDDFYCFLAAPVYPKRVCGTVKPQTATNYIKEIRLELGYFHHILGIPLEQLSLDLLFPLVLKEQLKELSEEEREALWDEKSSHVEQWTETYFQVIKQRNNSLSPRTKTGKLSPLKRLGHYRYRHQVKRMADYDSIPIFIALQARTSTATKEVKRWQNARTYVSAQDRKWPDTVEGETALTTLCRSVVEPLRLESRPRRKNGAFREGDVIAKSTQHYLKWAFLSDVPARRQKPYRDTRIALSCPLIRPNDVPADGCYFPLPPQSARDKNEDGTIADNYLHKAYAYKGKLYPEGVWVLELGAYKTEEVYGPYSMVIPNRQFDDGTCFYEYLDHYLCGWWAPGKFRDRHEYTWWDTSLQGQVGHWITKGWMEFNPVDLVLVEEPRGPLWRWGYLFPLPENGKHADGTSFGGSFVRTSYQLIGKRITPHMVRYFWATWAFQMGLTDRELESLAYAMGHSVKTLRGMYERCTPEEKLRPIFEAIDRLRLDKLEQSPNQVSAETVEQTLLRLAAELRRLSLGDRQKVISLVGEA